MSLFTAIDHPAIACQDVEAQAEWYCRILEMRVVARSNATPPAMVIGYDDDLRGGAKIELMPVRDAGPKPTDVPRFCTGLRHLALRVSSFDEAYARLTEAGVEFLFEPTTAMGGGKIVSFRDPEGNELQIVER